MWNSTKQLSASVDHCDWWLFFALSNLLLEELPHPRPPPTTLSYSPAVTLSLFLPSFEFWFYNNWLSATFLPFKQDWACISHYTLESQAMRFMGLQRVGHDWATDLIWLDQLGFTGGPSGKEPYCQCRRHKRLRFDPWVGKMPWKREWQPNLALLPRGSHGQRSLESYSSWGCKESDTT